MRLAERVLERRQLARPGCNAFDGGDRIAVGLYRKHQARAHGDAIDQDRAGAADAMLAARVCAVEQKLVAKGVEQAHPRLDVDRLLFLVDVELDLHECLAASAKASAMARTVMVSATRFRYAAEACRSAIVSMPSSAAVTDLRTTASS